MKVGRPILLLALLGIGVVVVHDVGVWRKECNPNTAYFKATDCLNKIHDFGPIRVYRGDQYGYPSRTVDLGDDTFGVTYWITHRDVDADLGRQGGEEEERVDVTPVEFVMRFNNIDDWSLVKLKVGDGEWRQFDERLSPTRFVNSIWW